MKTGIVTADPRKVCWKDYFYHGIWRRCRVSCEPEPVITPPIGPPPPPCVLDYPADTLPENNPEPMYNSSTTRFPVRYVNSGAFWVEKPLGSGGGNLEEWRFNRFLNFTHFFEVKARFYLTAWPSGNPSSLTWATWEAWLFFPMWPTAYMGSIRQWYTYGSGSDWVLYKSYSLLYVNDHFHFLDLLDNFDLFVQKSDIYSGYEVYLNDVQYETNAPRSVDHVGFQMRDAPYLPAIGIDSLWYGSDGPC